MLPLRDGRKILKGTRDFAEIAMNSLLHQECPQDGNLNISD